MLQSRLFNLDLWMRVQPLPAGLGKVVKGQGDGRFAGSSAALDRRANWHLLWAMGRTGHGRVPLGFLSEVWAEKPHRGQKYAHPTPAAAWVISAVGQNDSATINALISRLELTGDPPWLKGDIVGALTALTGERFGYDIAAWRLWHKKHRAKN